eukprot:CAMPEP_0185728572 /NCGR_PEP_ID=MMETSP1171-20130828/3900_1 /TAXON_ID=374046 /ORGANISM="Helicotheca tamensis, Strain CCMP826" /LENGTH=242 /DNA_ID=CAMNT_0028397295 /DNA_START=97 /DNA_END=825 /DNA_ORIENTATION=+
MNIFISASLSILLFSVHSVTSFSTICTRQQTTFRAATTRIYGTSRPDTADAVAEALRISKEFGATSPEARVAWDAVEEMDSNDSSAAFSSTITTSAKGDYFNQIQSLAFLMKETKEKLSQMKTLANHLMELELTDPSLTQLGPEAENIRNALAEAKAAVGVHGPHSPEAESAWSALDDCVNLDECEVDSHYRYSAAALKAHHSYDAVVDAESIQEAIEAFEKIENFARFVEVEKNRLDIKSA